MNWRLLAGFVLSIGAFLSYFMFFSRFPITRDVPWLSFLLFAAAIALLVTGWRHARRKVLASIVAILGVAVFGFFTFLILRSSNLPQSANAPAVGQKAPGFTLQDMNGQPVSLGSVLARSNGVLLVFYRGYW